MGSSGLRIVPQLKPPVDVSSRPMGVHVGAIKSVEWYSANKEAVAHASRDRAWWDSTLYWLWSQEYRPIRNRNEAPKSAMRSPTPAESPRTALASRKGDAFKQPIIISVHTAAAEVHIQRVVAP